MKDSQYSVLTKDDIYFTLRGLTWRVTEFREGIVYYRTVYPQQFGALSASCSLFELVKKLELA